MNDSSGGDHVGKASNNSAKRMTDEALERGLDACDVLEEEYEDDSVEAAMLATRLLCGSEDKFASALAASKSLVSWQQVEELAADAQEEDTDDKPEPDRPSKAERKLGVVEGGKKT